jgi:hypothetical protein
MNARLLDLRLWLTLSFVVAILLLAPLGPGAAVIVIAIPILALVIFGYLAVFYRAAFTEPRRRYPDGPPSRWIWYGALLVMGGQLVLGVGDYLFRYLIPPARPLLSPLWLLPVELARDWAAGLAFTVPALVVTRLIVLAWQRVRGRRGASPAEARGDAS